MPSINIATEDELSEVIAERLIMELGLNWVVELKLRKGGFGYLRSKIDSFCEMTKRTPMLLLSDLDQKSCPAVMIKEWLGGRKLPPKFLFRIPVREAESWVMADRRNFSKLLGISISLVSKNPDSLPDPKQELLRLANKSKGQVKDDLIAQKGAIASQGLGYNNRLRSFIYNTWDPAEAATNSESLRRTRLRLAELA